MVYYRVVSRQSDAENRFALIGLKENLDDIYIYLFTLMSRSQTTRGRPASRAAPLPAA